MRSHIHELWEELDLEPLYPEPELDRVMDQVMDRIAAEEPQAEGTAHVIKERRRPMQKRKGNCYCPWRLPWWCSPVRRWRWEASWAC